MRAAIAIASISANHKKIMLLALLSFLSLC